MIKSFSWYDGYEVVEVPLVEAENVQIIDFGGRSSQTEPIDPRARKRGFTQDPIKGPPPSERACTLTPPEN